MTSSRSPLNRASIVAAMTELLGPTAVETGDEQLKAASVDRFKKYTAVHGIYDGPIPAAIVYPGSTADVAAILRFAQENLVNVVPRTGRTATEGGLETVVEDSLVVDGSRMNAILSIDSVDMVATVQCGVGLQELEDLLRAAGPDIRHIVIGSEGALCFITEVTVKLFRYRPQNNRYFGFLVPGFADGVAALRELITAGYRPSVCRVYSPEDARQHFADFYQGRNVVVFVAEGPEGIVEATAAAIEELFAGLP